MASAAVIVVTYNHAAHIARCLRALLALDPSPAEILVVDNASTDGTAALVRRDFPQIRLVEAGANLGFAGANNLAVRATSAPYVVLANPDLEVRPDWLGALLRPLETIERAGIAGGRLLFPDGRTLQHAGGMLQLPLALGQHRGHGEPDDGRYSQIEPVEYVTGATLACSRELWEQLGGMDDGFYPAYYEEVDFCMRARAKGRAVLYVPHAVALHEEAAGLGRHSPGFYLYFHRNRLRLLFKHFQAEWHLHTWLPAELRYLRSVAVDTELDVLAAVYLAYQTAALAGNTEARVSLLDLHPDETPSGGETELQWVTRQLQAKSTLRLQPPQARNPLVAGLRRLASRLLVADELRSLAQQQSDANAAAAEAIVALARQRRASDAAVLLQGMLLARLWRSRREEGRGRG